MSLKERIKIPLYLVGSLINISLVSLFWVKSYQEFSLFLGVLVASMANHLFLIKGVMLAITNPYLNPVHKRELKIGIFFLAKSAVLILAFYAAAEFFPDKILYALLIYIFQLIILGLSIKSMN